MFKFLMIGAAVVAAHAVPASAAPGLDSKVYGTSIGRGVTEFEARYGRLTGRADDGASALVLEISHGFSKRFYGALKTTLEREPGGATQASSIGVEGIYRLGMIPGVGVDVAIYGEYNAALHGEPHNLETKLLLEKTVGRFDARLNLVAERLATARVPVEFSYAGSADYAVIGDELRLGVEAFGALGDSNRFGGRRAHFIGPVARIEIERFPLGGELEIETGYLFAVGAAADNSRGQARIGLEWGLRF